MSAITPFDFHGHQVRVITADDGEPRWVAADVASILSLGRTHDMVRGLDDDERGTDTIRTPSGDQEMTTVTEAGLYVCILRSRKPEAKEFRRWVTHEVLPTIRRTGSYGTPVVDAASLSRTEILQIAVNAESERLALEQKNKVLEPKADAYDQFMDATGKYAVGAVAKMLGTGQNRLFQELRNRGVFIAKGAMRNTPRQEYMHHFEVIPHDYDRKDGTSGTSYTTYVQPSGIDFIRKKLDFERIDPPAPAAA